MLSITILEKEKIIMLTLQEYKKEVIKCLIETYKVTSKEAEELMKAQEDYWNQLLNDKLIPQEVAYGMVKDLL